MCEFMSALVLKSGEVLTHPVSDSHADLVTRFGLRDDDHRRRFAKVEFVPDDWLRPETWEFKLDEKTAPDWWTENLKEQTCQKLVAKATGMILADGEHDLIADGVWIVGGDAVVRDVRAGRIVSVGDSARIENVWDSARIENVWGSARIESVGGSVWVRRSNG